jgi:hypothetical protein
MSAADDELRAAVRLLRPSSPTVAQHTVAVRLAPATVEAVAQLLDAFTDLARDYPDLARDHDRAVCDDYACDVTGHALALARLINTGNPT